MKYGIKAIMRTPGRTLLFGLLILVTCGFLSLGIGMWNSAERMLAQADEVFITAGEFTYTGGNYPDETFYDEGLQQRAESFGTGALAALPGVTLFEEALTHRAEVDGFTPKAAPMGNVAILLLRVESLAEAASAANCSVQKVIYSGQPLGGDSPLVMLTPSAEDDNAEYERALQAFYAGLGENEYSNAFDHEHYYDIADYYTPGDTLLVIGAFYDGRSSTKTFRPYGEVPETIRNLAGEVPAGIAPLTDLTGRPQSEVDALLAGETGQFLEKVAQSYTAINNTVALTATACLDAVEVFHRGEYLLESGTLFTGEDYQSGEACVIPGLMAEALGVRVGDSIGVKVHRATGRGGSYDSYWPDTGYAAEVALEVRGIYKTPEAGTPVYIPSAGQDWLAHSGGNYTLARMVMDNRRARDVIAAAQALLPGDITLSAYDQGYEKAALPILSMRETAVLITLVCAACCLLVLVFFGYFYVLRNGESTRILLALGAGKRRVYAFLLSGCGVVTLLASAIGGAAGFLLSGGIARHIYTAELGADRYDRRFSVSGYGIRSADFAAEPEAGLSALFIAVLGVFCVAMLLCLALAWQNIRAQNPHHRRKMALRAARKRLRQKERAPKTAAGARLALRLRGVALRYAVRSLPRGGARLLILPAVFAASLVFACLFAGLRGGYQSQLDTVYETVPVTLRITDLRGRYRDDMKIPEESVQVISDSGFVAEERYSLAVRYEYNGRILRADGTPDTPMDEMRFTEVPSSTFAYETFENQFKRRFDPLYFTSSIGNAPEFAFVDSPSLTFAEGFDEGVLAEDSKAWLSFGYMTQTGWGWPYEAYELLVDAGDEIITYDSYEAYEQDTEFWEEKWAEYALARPPVLVPERFLREHGLALGDTVVLTFYYLPEGPTGEIRDYYTSRTFTCTIAGSFTGRTTADTLYIPWSTGVASKYQAASFLLKNTDNLPALKDYLSGYYSEANTITTARRWLTIDDAALYDTIETLEQHITYMNLLYPVVLFMAGLIGFLISNMLLKSRRREVATLRCMGSPKRTVFLSFFLEQLLLCLPGLAVGVALAALILGGPAGVSWPIVLACLLCYLAGAALAIRQLQQSGLLQDPAKKED